MNKRFTALILVSAGLWACAPERYGGPMGGWDQGWAPMMYYGHGGVFMWLLFLVLVAVVIFLVVRTSKLSGPAPPVETPLDILKKRYAKGEITKEEYDRMKKELSD
ncbi:MAG TPA: SHOCT domain-containing protein [Syntrophales bacterium]|nr:SHOCT domain-containing protein [Syntrophales bacterium]HQM30014.1 SHOCT domain-containing protein [Syntrophales bacterium]